MFTNGPRRDLKHPILMIIVFAVSAGLIRLITTEQSLSTVFYAFQLFGTLVHEIGHSVAAQLTGGQVHGFVIQASSGGFAQTSGGNWFIILSAGYVGCAIFGSAVFYLSNRFRWADFFGFWIGVFIIIFTLTHGKPEENGSMTAHHVAIAFGVILIALGGFYGPIWLNMLFVNIVSALTALHGLMGAWTLYVLSFDWHHNDAEMFSDALNNAVSGNVIALVWALMSVFLFWLAFYFGVYRTMRDNNKKWNYIHKGELYNE